MTETPKIPEEPEEPEVPPALNAYDTMVQDRLAMMKQDYEAFPRPDYLKEGESKLVPYMMGTMAELFVRCDIIMDKLHAKDLSEDPAPVIEKKLDVEAKVIDE